MSVTHFNTQDTKALTTGLDRDRMARVRWEQVADATGVRRAAIVTDLVRFDLRPEIRLNPAVAKRMGVAEVVQFIDPDLGPTVLTTEWQAVRANVASAIWAKRREERQLGGEYAVEKPLSDGYGGQMWVPERLPGEPDLVEVRLPGDTALVVASS